jgi:hypothetical protein
VNSALRRVETRQRHDIVNIVQPTRDAHLTTVVRTSTSMCVRFHPSRIAPRPSVASALSQRVMRVKSSDQCADACMHGPTADSNPRRETSPRRAHGEADRIGPRRCHRCGHRACRWDMLRRGQWIRAALPFKRAGHRGDRGHGVVGDVVRAHTGLRCGPQNMNAVIGSLRAPSTASPLPLGSIVRRIPNVLRVGAVRVLHPVAPFPERSPRILRPPSSHRGSPRSRSADPRSECEATNPRK